MSRDEQPRRKNRENQALRDRLSRLTGAILRISSSLDLETVLREVVDNGRVLTGARYGAITILDSGQPQGLITSGITSEEHQRLINWPEGPQLFEHLRALAGPLRLDDLPAWVRSLGFCPDLMLCKTFQATPMLHRGEHVGTFYLGGKEQGRSFTAEDEEILRLFAAQAATAVANARAHRNEQQARARLETLIDTSPVGVVVFDGRTGEMVSLNLEAKRIVEGLRGPDRSLEELLKVVTCLRADGGEVALDEFPLAQVLGQAETVRAEEIELRGPDGRRIRTLVNATPILTGDGEVESVIVTLQDLTPIQDLERMRVEFLAMVSHELRPPLTSIRGSTATMLGASPGLPPAEMLEFCRIIDQQADHMQRLVRDLLDAERIESGTLSVTPESSDVGDLVDQARSTFLSGGRRHPVLIDLPPDLPRVMADRLRVVQILNNLLANAARHSPESSPIQLGAKRDGVHVAITVCDEGRGMSPEQLAHLFRKYTGLDREGERGLRGSGLGLVICQGLVEAHGGRIWAASGGTGQGAQLTFTLPVAEEARHGPAADPPTPRARSPLQGAEPTRILVVDDDPRALRSMRDALAEAGYAPIVTGNPRELAGILQTEKPHLVLLDLVLPETDGIELMASVPELADRPVIFISAYRRDETIAKAMDLGAADYIVKPFSPTELAARVRAALRRQTPDRFVLGDLAIDYPQRRVTVEGHPVSLTVTEYEGAAPALGQRGTGLQVRHAAPPGMGKAGLGQPIAGAHFRDEPPPQARR